MKHAKEKPAAINLIWFGLMLFAVLVALAKGNGEAVTKASFDSAKTAVDLAIKLIGVMALWLGLMRIAEVGGLMQIIAGWIRPLMVWLFPGVPAKHPAMGAMIMNMAANMLGLGNAATPLGIKAMLALNRLNPTPGRATHAMCLFLAINTSSVTLLPLGVIGLRAAAGAKEPASIFLPSLLATMTSTLVAILAAKTLARLADQSEKEATEAEGTGTREDSEQGEDLHKEADSDGGQSDDAVQEDSLIPPGIAGKSLVLTCLVAFLAVLGYRLGTASSLDTLSREMVQFWIIPILMAAILLFGYWRGVKVYETAASGAKEGFDVAVRIIPFLVVILVAIGMFKASGAFAILAGMLSPITETIGLPADVLPMALMRPLSGSGAFGVLSELVTSNPDGFSAYMASIMQGSTETTFYVLAVYFGAAGITKARYAIAAALLADAAGIAASIALAHLTFPG